MLLSPGTMPKQLLALSGLREGYGGTGSARLGCLPRGAAFEKWALRALSQYPRRFNEL